MYFENVFLNTTGVKEQFQFIDFNLDENPNLLNMFSKENLEFSLFNTTNMYNLFYYGKQCEYLPNEKYNVEPMSAISDYIGNLNKEEVFVIYSWVQYLVNNTFINQGDNEPNTP